MWDFPKLQNYLLSNGLITDENWLDNHLRPEFKRAMIHLLRASYFSFWRSSQLFEIYGIDFLLDENMDLWFLENNMNPVLSATS
mmetsp:Transcript_32500/g.29344  ORF Transcript_32500/g.29344 Transcript_32500/m.29344 type:complete len:84 (+) Transcript_32500:961-1212(+)